MTVEIRFNKARYKRCEGRTATSLIFYNFWLRMMNISFPLHHEPEIELLSSFLAFRGACPVSPDAEDEKGTFRTLAREFVHEEFRSR